MSIVDIILYSPNGKRITKYNAQRHVYKHGHLCMLLLHNLKKVWIIGRGICTAARRKFGISTAVAALETELASISDDNFTASDDFTFQTKSGQEGVTHLPFESLTIIAF